LSAESNRAASPLGVLFVNLGSPSAPTSSAVRAYLEEFLSDPMVVDLPRWRWALVRRLFILPLRAPKSAALYRKVWTEEGSPLVVFSRRFAGALARALGPAYRVALGMRYGAPALSTALAELRAAGCERVLVFPAFPQQSRTTTGTAVLEVGRALRALGWAPSLGVLAPYFADPGFVRAWAARLRAVRVGDEHVVFSFHGLPVRYVEEGDPYRDHCEATARALAAELGLAPGRWTLVYQSRFGREPWLEPEAARVVPELAAAEKRLVLAAPSFPCDCLETLEELGLRLAEDCACAGGLLTVVPCLNDQEEWVAAAAELVRASTAGRAP